MKRLVAISLLAGCGPAPSSLPAPPSATPALAGAVTEVAFTVDDLDGPRRLLERIGATVVGEQHASAADVAALTGVRRGARVLRLRLGDEIISLVDHDGGAGRGWREGARSNDLDFQHIAIVVRDIDAAFAAVRPAITLVSPGPQRIPDSNPAAGGIRAHYLRTAEGDPLELIWYPAGRGDPRWQTAPGELLGIDHTAIASSDTDRSRAFYGALGFRVAGEALNTGVEQERLSGVAGARVRITGMAGARGPGVELLEYLAPGPGRAARADASADDLDHVETEIEVSSLEAAITAAVAAGGTHVAGPAPCVLCDGARGRGALVRDPDGHAIRLVER